MTQKNNRLQEEILAFSENIRSQVTPSEIKTADARSTLIRKLIPFISKKSISNYHKEDLIDWVHSQILELQLNPFLGASIVEPLQEAFEQQLNILGDHEQEKFEKKLLKKGFSKEQIEEIKEAAQQMEDKQDDVFDDLFEDLFAEYAEEADMSDDIDLESQFNENREYEQRKDNQKEQELGQLLKASPVNQLFRKVARALHPDLETDEHKKKQKHQLMSNLIDARDNKDIGFIIAMYIEHVGDIPKGLFEGNFEKMTQLLKHQVKKLRDQHDHILHDEGDASLIYNKFYDKNTRVTQKYVERYITENLASIDGLREIASDIRNIPTLKHHLEIRAQLQYLQSEQDDIPF